MNHQLCKEYPAFTPLDIEERPFKKVIGLYVDVRNMQIREKKAAEEAAANPAPRKKKDDIIRRPAGDSWF